MRFVVLIFDLFFHNSDKPALLKEKIVVFVISYQSSSMNYFQLLLKTRSAHRQSEDHAESAPQASRQILFLFYLYI